MVFADGTHQEQSSRNNTHKKHSHIHTVNGMKLNEIQNSQSLDIEISKIDNEGRKSHTIELKSACVGRQFHQIEIDRSINLKN